MKNNIDRELHAFKYMKEALQSEFEGLDDETLLDTLSGETNLLEAIDELVGSALLDEKMAQATKARLQEIKGRAKRLEDRAKKKRDIVREAFEKAELKGPLQLSNATVSLGNTPAKLVIADETQVPDEFLKVADPTIDEKKLKDAMKDGKTFSFAYLSNGGKSLIVRAK